MSAAPRPLVALAGNPNTGKTTLWNALTGNRERVGNYPGITVERTTGTVILPEIGSVEFLDVPGTYSLVASSPDERLAIEVLLGLSGARRPDAVVLCVDATQLARSLYLVLQAQELGLPVVVALTMSDEAGPAAPDPERLAHKLGCAVVPVLARDGTGLAALKSAIASRVRDPERKEVWRWQPSEALNERLKATRAALPDEWPRLDALALWALMSLEPNDEHTGIPARLRAATALAEPEARAIDDEVICSRYAFIDREIAPLVAQAPDRQRTTRVDRVLLHPVWGLLIFVALMFGVFQALFAGAEPVIGLIEDLFAWGTVTLHAALPAGLFADFLIDGVVGGVGAVVVFLPQILLLFFFLGLLEDTGYMARVAFLVDRLMRTMNLHGRAFVPILSGFACAVPAIMATRTMERQRDRILTMMVVPLTTCSARLPIYTLIIAGLFPSKRVFGLFPVQGLMMVGMYLFGIGTALVVAWVLSRTIKPLRARRLPFVIELPPYRRPLLRDVIHQMLRRAKLFLYDAGRVIVVCSIALWALLSFPRGDTNAVAPITGVGGQSDTLQAAQRLQNSYAGRLGRSLEFALEPLGFDWKIGVGIIGAFAAREVFIATMGVVYGIAADPGDDPAPLRERMRDERHPDGRPVYTPLVGFSLMIFFALACQCMSTLAVVRRETQSLRWPVFLFAYMTMLAWLASFTVYQGGRLLGLS